MILRLRRFCIMFALGTAADQLTKALAQRFLADNEVYRYFWGCLEFRYVENFAGFLGYLHFLPETIRFSVLTTGVVVVLLIFGYILIRYPKITFSQFVAGILVLAGGTGNLIDRLLNNGGVIDFIVIGIGAFRTGVFNLADLYILAGAFYLGCSLADSYQSFTRPASRP